MDGVRGVPLRVHPLLLPAVALVLEGVGVLCPVVHATSLDEGEQFTGPVVKGTHRPNARAHVDGPSEAMTSSALLHLPLVSEGAPIVGSGRGQKARHKDGRRIQRGSGDSTRKRGRGRGEESDVSPVNRG